jgi:DNA invertase Pin-like site-specific DNA recombinase
MTKAYGYIRCSSASQSAEDRDGPVRQRLLITQWAAANDTEIVDWFEDSISGKTDHEDRPAFTAMLTAIHADGVQMVIVERLDRLARRLRVQETIISDLQNAGIRLISTAEPDLDSDNEDRVMIRQILGAVAEHTAKAIVAKLRGARQRAAAKDPTYKEGRKAYGDRPGEKETIERIRTLRAEGLHLAQIAARLEAEGRKPRKSDKWNVSSIRLILGREQ